MAVGTTNLTSNTNRPAAAETATAPTTATASASATECDKSPMCNILIVDDEPSNLLALEAILEPLGQRIIRARSGVEALKQALKIEFCVVLLDVQMPEMDGLETAELLRKRPRTRDVPIIFLTAISKEKSHVARGYDVGAVDYLFKPYDPDTLRTKVGTFVELAKKNAIIRAQHEALRVGSEQALADFKRWSERRYEDLADSIPQVVWTADAAGTITYHNRRWAELAAGSSETTSGNGGASSSNSNGTRDSTSEFATIAHPDDVASFSQGWKSAVRVGSEWEAELRIGTRGHYRFHLVRAIPRHDDHDGKIIAWVGTATDIDARVRADRALRMLAEASHRLTRSLEEPRELEAVLRAALPVLGDGAILDVQTSAESGAGGTGVAERWRVARKSGLDTEATSRVQAILADPRLGLGPATVVYSGRPEVYFDVAREHEAARSTRLKAQHVPASTSPTTTPSSSDTLLSSSSSSSSIGPPDSSSEGSERNPNPSGRGSEHLRFLAELGVSAYICVPLVTHNRTIGTLTCVRLINGESFDQGDVELAGDLARRIAVSIDNARLHATSEKRRMELELANKSKDVFLATLSHELRTPLNAIVGWTDMMKNGTLSGPELSRAMETIDRNAHALSGLVGDLLDVSRIVTGTLKLDSKRVSVASIVETAVLAAGPQCAAKHIGLDLKVEGEPAGTSDVIGDPGRLRQIIANLLSNAIKFTKSNGIVSVTVGTSGNDLQPRVRIIVSDTGEGIAPEFLPHVFERFRQEVTGRAKGLGLGLAIVKHLVEEHGGSVSAMSEGRGAGATFTVELPAAGALAAVAVAAAGDEAADHPSMGTTLAAAASIADPESGTTSAIPDLTDVHVLIVEDDPDGNELVCTILERYGARVTSTTTGADALAALSKEHPSILISDIGLPDLDGMDLIKAVRARPEKHLREIPAIALTAYASRQDATKAIAAGFDAHVAKPVQPATLGTAVARLLARSATSAA